MQITVLKTNAVTEQGKKGPYKVAELVYKSGDSAPKSTRVLEFLNKALFDTVLSFGQDDVVEARFEKNDKGYWNLVEANKSGAKSTAGNTGQVSTASKGNWETSEERAHRQVAIARQSSLERAIEYFQLVDKKAMPDEIINVADEFVNYVLSGKADKAKAGRPRKVEQDVAHTGDVE